MNGEEAGYLERLRVELSRRGLRCEVITSACKPRLRIHVPGPHGGPDALFEDNVVAAARPDGRWSFWWPWVEEICAAGDPAHAARVIITTLGLDVSGHDPHGEVSADRGQLDHPSRAGGFRRRCSRSGGCGGWTAGRWAPRSGARLAGHGPEGAGAVVVALNGKTVLVTSRTWCVDGLCDRPRDAACDARAVKHAGMDVAVGTKLAAAAATVACLKPRRGSVWYKLRPANTGRPARGPPAISGKRSLSAAA